MENLLSAWLGTYLCMYVGTLHILNVTTDKWHLNVYPFFNFLLLWFYARKIPWHPQRQKKSTYIIRGALHITQELSPGNYPFFDILNFILLFHFHLGGRGSVQAMLNLQVTSSFSSPV